VVRHHGQQQNAGCIRSRTGAIRVSVQAGECWIEAMTSFPGSSTARPPEPADRRTAIVRRSARRSPGRRIGALLAVATLAALPPSLDSATPEVSRKLAAFEIVDCLLPGQMRRLGGATYMMPPRPARIVLSECQIRGGEYVLYDRADLATALRIWLPAAEAGDKVAQTYVGQVYERGAGGAPPDYRSALGWYEKAAAQGHPAALASLGYLYEKGLGVDRDPVRALNLYRKAFDVPGTLVLDGEEAAASREAETRALREQLRTLQRELEESRRQLDLLRDRSGTEIDRLEREKRQAAAQGSAATARDLELRIREREAELESQRNRVVALERTLAQAQGKLRDAESVAQASASREEQIRALQSDLARTRHELAAARADQERERVSLSAEIRRLVAEKRTADQSGAAARADQLEALIRHNEGALQQQRQRVLALEQALEQSQGRLRETEASLGEAVATRDEQIRFLHDELERTRTALVGARRAQESLAATNAAELQQLRRERAAMQSGAAAAKALEERIARKESEAAEQRTRVKALEGELAAVQARLRAVESNAVSLQEQLRRAQQRADGLEGEVSRRQAAVDDLSARLAQAKAAPVNPAMQRRVAALEADVQSAGAELRKARAERDSVEREREQLQQQLARLQDRVDKGSADTATQAPRTPRPEVARPQIVLIEPPLSDVAVRGPIPISVRGTGQPRELYGRVKAPAGVREFFVNGRSEPVRGADNEFKTRVVVRAPHLDVEFVAIDRRLQRGSLAVRLVPEGSPELREKPGPWGVGAETFGDYHALVIWAANYPMMPKLDTPKADAEAVEELLRTRFGFRTRVLADATRADILEAIEKYARELAERDNLLIYYAGHGTYDAVGNAAYWQPLDARQDSSTNWIQLENITAHLNRMRARKVLVVSDSCFSGALALSVDQRVLGEEDARTSIERDLQYRARNVLSSGGYQMVLDGAGGTGPHSVFAKHFLAALRNANQLATARSIYEVVRANVARETRTLAAAPIQQEPQYGQILRSAEAGTRPSEFYFVPRPSAQKVSSTGQARVRLDTKLLVSTPG
jgi:predicted  nucleic acid-binding Zn-ribbon protein